MNRIMMLKNLKIPCGGITTLANFPLMKMRGKFRKGIIKMEGYSFLGVWKES